MFFMHRPTIPLIIFSGFFLRFLLAIWNGFFEFPFGQTADPGSCNGNAMRFAGLINQAMHDPLPRNLWEECSIFTHNLFSCGLGIIYYVTVTPETIDLYDQVDFNKDDMWGITLFVGGFSSCLAWVASALIFVKIMQILSIEKRTQKKILMFYVLIPSTILFSGITVREPYQLFIVNLMVFISLKIVNYRVFSQIEHS